jgi:AcrR family transcriptional regulator
VSRGKILDAAAQVFSERGYALAGMDEIAIRAGVAKGTLYYHFSGKSELFRTVVVDGIRALSGETRAVFESALPLREQMRSVIRKHVEMYLSHRDLANVVFRESGTGVDDEALREIEAARDDHVRLLADILRNGHAIGACRQVDFERTACGLLGLLDGCCRYHPDGAGPPDPEEIARSLFELIGEGLLLPGG